MRRLIAMFLAAWLLAAPSSAQEQVDDGLAKGLALFRAGRYEDALPFFRRALDLAEARYGPDDPAIAVELNNLAEVHRKMGHLDDAESLYQKAIELDRRAGREATAEFATSLNNLALVYRAQGRPGEAERLYKQALVVLEQALGPLHPDVARALNNLAVLHRMAGHPERARPLQERALAIVEKALGPRHPDTEVLRRNLAVLDRLPSDGRPAPLPSPPRPSPTVAMAAVAPDTGAAPPEAPAAANGYTVQVAAVREADGAEAEWRRLAALYPLLKELPLQPPQRVEVPANGTWYRVFVGSFAAKGEADATCERLRTAGAYCRATRR